MASDPTIVKQSQGTTMWACMKCRVVVPELPRARFWSYPKCLACGSGFQEARHNPTRKFGVAGFICECGQKYVLYGLPSCAEKLLVTCEKCGTPNMTRVHARRVRSSDPCY